MAYIVKCTFINKDEDGNVTYKESSGVTCGKIAAQDYYEYLLNRNDTKNVILEKVN